MAHTSIRHDAASKFSVRHNSNFLVKGRRYWFWLKVHKTTKWNLGVMSSSDITRSSIIIFPTYSMYNSAWHKMQPPALSTLHNHNIYSGPSLAAKLYNLNARSHISVSWSSCLRFYQHHSNYLQHPNFHLLWLHEVSSLQSMKHLYASKIKIPCNILWQFHFDLRMIKCIKREL